MRLTSLMHLHHPASCLRAQRHSYLRCFATGTSDQPHAKLNDGRSIPLLGLGTWKHTREQAAQAVEVALDTGYKHIDCATAYSNHDAIGPVFSKKFKGGGLKREDIWITTKLFNSDHASAAVPKACKKALSELQLDYLDLYLVHWPAVADCTGDVLTPSIRETWMAMERLVDDGLCKSIGISNFSVAKTRNVIQDARHPPVVNQVESHPYWRQDALHHYCDSMNVHLTAYSPLGTPDSAEMMKRKDDPKVLEDSTVGAIASELGKTPAQILLRWGIQRGFSVIPKATSPDRIRENFGALSFELSSEQMEKLSTLEYQARYVAGTFLLNPEGPYRTLDQLWDGEVSDINRKQAQAAGF